MDERPNVTVIYQTPPAKGPGLGAIILELLTFFAIAGALALGAALLR